MNKKDGRAIPHAVREEIRKRAVSRVLAGESPAAVIEALGFHRSCIYDWLKQYRRYGEGGLQTKPISGRPRKFDEALWVPVGTGRCGHGPGSRCGNESDDELKDPSP